MPVEPIIVFVATYVLYLLSSFVWKIDFAYYGKLVKPAWTPPGPVIGIVWGVLFACISLSLALLDAKVGILGLGVALSVAVVANWLANQAYAYLQFARKDWLAAAYDSAFICLTAVVWAVLAWPISASASLLVVPYIVWTAFATYLSWLIWSLNR
jgi:tryptophan-rich sensory protein